jgi:hypothetical protein
MPGWPAVLDRRPRQKPVLHSADSQPRVEVNCHKLVAWLLRRGKCMHIPECKATLVMWLGTMSSGVAQIVLLHWWPRVLNAQVP